MGIQDETGITFPDESYKTSKHDGLADGAPDQSRVVTDGGVKKLAPGAGGPTTVSQPGQGNPNR